MKEHFKQRPIASSIKTVGAIFLAYMLARIILIATIAPQGATHLYLDGFLRGFLAIIGILLLGILVKQDGFEYVFSPVNSRKALVASIPIITWILATSIHFFNIAELNRAFMPMIPAIILFDSMNGIYEEVLFRGLLMAAMLYYFGNTTRGRLAILFFNAAIFGLIHISDGIFAVFITFLIGLGFASIYMYSNNLLVLIVIHALWNIVMKTTNGLILDVHSLTLVQIVNIVQHTSLFVAIPVFAIFIAIKSEPFSTKVRLISEVDV